MNTTVAASAAKATQRARPRTRIPRHSPGTWRAYGQGLVEYALILALIAIVVIGILNQLGGKTSQIFSSVSCTLDGGAVASSNSSHPGNPQGGGGGVGNNTSTTTTGGC